MAGIIAGSVLFMGVGLKAVCAEDVDYSKLPGMPKLEIMSGNDRWGCEVLLCLANPNGPRVLRLTSFLTVFLGGIRASFRPARWLAMAIMPSNLATALIHALCKAWRMHLKGS